MNLLPLIQKMHRALAVTTLPSIVVLAFGTAVLAASAASAADQPAVADAAKTAQTSNDDKTICKKIEVTGTRFAKSDCRTAREWDILDKKSKGNAEEYMRKTSENAGIAPTQTLQGGGRTNGVLDQ